MGRVGKFTRKITEIIALDRPSSIVIAITLGLSALWLMPNDWIDRSPVKCIFRTYIIPFFYHGHCPTSGWFPDCKCPGCGITHALWQMMHGHFRAAYGYNHFVYVIFGLILGILGYNLYLVISDYSKRG